MSTLAPGPTAYTVKEANAYVREDDDPTKFKMNGDKKVALPVGSSVVITESKDSVGAKYGHLQDGGWITWRCGGSFVLLYGNAHSTVRDTRLSTIGIRLRSMPGLESTGLYPNQRQAVTCRERSLRHDKLRALLQMVDDINQTISTGGSDVPQSR